MSGYENNSIFWVETEKIDANPFQPRREFEPGALDDLADSIRQYGVLQPLVVTRREDQTDNGGFSVSYELIAGERRLRASRIAGLKQVPVIIRKETNNKIKLELAIIENLQREDLNPIDRALAFEQLYKEFELTHAEIGKRMGKSRVYVSNSLRLLGLPENIKQGLMNGRITEGHTRPLLMLGDKPDEQQTLFTEIMTKKMSVRESEKIARSIAQDKVRKKEFIIDPRIRRFEKRLSENLGTRVQIAQGEKGGKITIDYFTLKDLEGILQAVNKVDYVEGENMMDRYLNEQGREIAQKTLSDSGPIDFITGETKSLHENKPLDEPVQVQTKPQSDTTNIDNGFSVSEKKPEIQNTPNYNHTQKKTDDFFLKPLPQINALDSYHKQPDEEIILAKKSLPEFTHDKGHEITTYHKNSEIQQSADSMKKITSDSVQTPEPARSQNSFTLAKENVQNVEDFIDPDFFNSDVATVTAAEKTNQPDWNNQKHSAQNTPQQNQQNDNRIQYQSNPTQQPALQQNADQYHGNVMRHNNAPQQVVQNHGAVHQQSNTNQYHYQQTQPTYQNPAYVQQQQKKSFLGKLFN